MKDKSAVHHIQEDNTDDAVGQAGENIDYASHLAFA